MCFRLPPMRLFFTGLAFVIWLFIPAHGRGQSEILRKKIVNLVNNFPGKVGVAMVGLEFFDSLSINGHHRFPMQSVYKFPLAMAVLNQVDKGAFTLDQKIHLTRRDLLPKTWSPLRDKYPRGNVNVTLREILQQTVSYSDNNGCDILFRLIGGPKKAQDYIHGLGVKNIAMVSTEKELHKDWNLQFANWTTPLGIAQLLQVFYYRNKLSKTSNDFLWEALTSTTTGPNRLKGLLPPGTEVGHKTGSSGDRNGLTAATNDVGIITLPNGKHYILAVFVSMTKEKEAAQEKLIAQISKACYDYFDGKD